MNIKHLFLFGLLFLSAGSFASIPEDDEGPNCPEVPELTEEESERIFIALGRGETVIQCKLGLCWDFVTLEPYETNRFAEDGLYFVYMQPWEDKHLLNPLNTIIGE